MASTKIVEPPPGVALLVDASPAAPAFMAVKSSATTASKIMNALADAVAVINVLSLINVHFSARKMTIAMATPAVPSDGAAPETCVKDEKKSVTCAIINMNA